MKSSLAKIAQQKKIKYFLISFVDLFGIQRAKLVPARAISEMQKTGAGFGGCCVFLAERGSSKDILKFLNLHFENLSLVDII